ncbi:hypothetical protein GOP47_0005926 [Adiantum capillus-veneris]|uniref:Uncharacterized protein n=1 Tax=Adiantum capillus-veneris TaxID=13818 RepID=A0A9D4V1W4_ADICA|nr:hypothetical protein GOP47_0005926 [Adiantum capillus-veneris]
MVMRRSGFAVKSEGRQLLWWSGKRAMSSFDDKGNTHTCTHVMSLQQLSVNESSEKIKIHFVLQRDLELLEKLRKQAEKLEKIKRELVEYKEGHTSLENWLLNTKLDKYKQK